ncbi:odorant receptor 13a-like [Vespula squamosa]|uniref:Odorant receptor 13a-like n=1 Tax=Vespula squamosa TaxID=30214 RepID=A0ABD2BWC6_VESSQ
MKYFGNVKFISKPLQTAVNNCGEICSKLENNNKKARNYLDSHVCLTLKYNFIESLIIFHTVMTNSSVEYKLPYKIKPLLKSNDAKSYTFGCIHEFLRTIIVISGYLGLELADIFEHCFNVVIGQQLLGTTTQLCISSYEILSIHICRSNGTRFISNK